MPGDTREERRIVVMPSASPSAIEWAAECLASGGIVSFPTDTVYGLATSLAHPASIERIFTVKGRGDDQPMPVLVSAVAQIEHLTHDLDPNVALLLDEIWPGPVTVVVPARAGMPTGVLGPGNTIGVRVPNHPLAIELIDRAGGAVACTSANRSGEEPARTAQEVVDRLGEDVDFILDGGLAPGGVASTVIRINGSAIEFLRQGAVPAEKITALWREIISGS